MKVAITGYASLDHVAILDRVPQPGRTTTILDRPEDAWPRLGGSPAYVAAALVADGVLDVFPVSWVGDDEAGGEYLVQLAEKRISNEGFEVIGGARTPIAILAYEPEGGCICLYDPGMRNDLGLSDTQRALIAEADWVCVTVGPPEATEAVLEELGDKAKLAWVVKHDPRAISPELATRLAARADLICHSSAETDFVIEALGAGQCRPGRIVIETQGRSGAALSRDGATHFAATKPMAVVDPTGAGDSFAGGVLAAIIRGETDPAVILEQGHRAARTLLEKRRIDQWKAHRQWQ